MTSYLLDTTLASRIIGRVHPGNGLAFRSARAGGTLSIEAVGLDLFESSHGAGKNEEPALLPGIPGRALDFGNLLVMAQPAADNEAGWRISLGKLAALVEAG